jgi:phage shock protein E
MINPIWQLKQENNIIHLDQYLSMKNEGLDIVLLDVRTQEEFDEKHIKDAILFPVLYIESYVEQYFPNKDLTYVIYCRSGVRSHHALKMMIDLGYNHVYDLGGIIDIKDPSILV